MTEVRSEDVFARDSYSCRYCGATGVELEIDHLIPISIGGENDIENLVSACGGCNRSKSDAVLSARTIRRMIDENTSLNREEFMETIKAPRIDVYITQEDIEQSIPCNSGHCMIAEAVKRAYAEKTGRKAYGVSVDIQCIRLTDRKMERRYIYLTPTTAQRGLLQFDQGIKPTPFRIRLKDGQVIRSFTRKSRKPAKRTEKQKEAHAMALKSAQDKNSQRAGMQVTSSGRNTSVTKIGGKAPPTCQITGHRRQFGARGIGDLSGPT